MRRSSRAGDSWAEKFGVDKLVDGPLECTAASRPVGELGVTLSRAKVMVSSFAF